MSASRGDVLWYVRRGGQLLGPFEAIELAVHAKTSRLLAGDLLWCQGLEQWVPAGIVPGLLPPAAPALGPQTASRYMPPPQYSHAAHSGPVRGPQYAIAHAPQHAVQPYDAQWHAGSAMQRGPATAPGHVSRLSPTGHVQGGARPALPMAERPLPASAPEYDNGGTPSIRERAVAKAQSLLAWSSAQIVNAAAKVAGSGNIEQISDQFHKLRWVETFETLVGRAVQRLNAPTLAVLLDDQHTRELATLLLEAMPTVARLAITLTIGKDGFEAAVMSLRNRIRERLSPADLNGPIGRTLPALLGSGVLSHQTRLLAERIRHEVSVALGRKIADPSGDAMMPTGRRLAS